MSDFNEEMTKVVLLLQATAHMDVDIDFLETTVARAEAFGPFIDPTAFVRGRAFQNLEEQRELLAIAGPFLRGAKRLLEKHGHSTAAASGGSTR